MEEHRHTIDSTKGLHLGGQYCDGCGRQLCESVSSDGCGCNLEINHIGLHKNTFTPNCEWSDDEAL